MESNHIFYLTDHLENFKQNSVFSEREYAMAETILIKLFDCKRITYGKKPPTLKECKCSSNLVKYLVLNWHKCNKQTFTLKFVGQYTLCVTFQLKGTGLVYVEVMSTPEGDLVPPMVLKTSFSSINTLNGLLISLLKEKENSYVLTL